MLLKYVEMKPPPLKFIMNPTINLKNGLLNECENNTLFFALFTFLLLTFSLLLLCTTKNICAPNKEDQIDQEKWIKHICLKKNAKKQNP